MEQDSSHHTWSAKVLVRALTPQLPQPLTWDPTPAAPPVLGTPWSSALPVPTELHCPCTCAWTGPGLHCGHPCLLLLQPPTWISQTAGTCCVTTPPLTTTGHQGKQLFPPRLSHSGAVRLCPEQGGHCFQRCAHLWLLACLPAWNSPILHFQPRKSPGSSWAWAQGGLR